MPSTEKEFRETITQILLAPKFREIDTSEKQRIINQTLVDVALKLGWNEDNGGNDWSDNELKIILSEAPTRLNCVRFAQAFKRGYGSIEQIYRWAATPDREIRRKRPEDAFIKQIKRVAKELGWRA